MLSLEFITFHVLQRFPNKNIHRVFITWIHEANTLNTYILSRYMKRQNNKNDRDREDGNIKLKITVTKNILDIKSARSLMFI